MNVLIFFGCFALIIILGTKLKINYGFLAVFFGFIITWAYLGGSARDYINLFPVTLFWNYGMPIIFYGFANGNGTLKNLGMHIVYKFRNATKAIPVVIAIVSIIISATGAGSSGTFVVAPLAWGICLPIGIDPLMVVVAVWVGTIAGGFVPWATGGILHLGWQEQFIGENLIWRENAFYFAFAIICFVLAFIFLKGWKAKGEIDQSVFQKPEPFNREQKITLYIMFAIILLLLVPSILNQFLKCQPWKWMSSNLAVPNTCAIGVVILSLLKVSDLKEVFAKHVNWNILFVIIFMSQFCGLAGKMGVTETLTEVLSGMPKFLIAPLFCLIACALSFCVSASTILPLMYSMVPALAAAAGIPNAAMMVPFVIGTGASSISPISTGGASCQIGAPKEVAEKLFTRQLILSILFSLLCVVLTFVGFFSIGA